MVFLLLYTALVTPFAIALLDIDKIEWLIIDLIVDMCFMTDVIVNCFLAYYNEENLLITEKRKILSHYLRTWMILDLIACIPFQLILNSSKDY